MFKERETIAIIPARGGSKGIPHKNIIDLEGYPLIAYSIVAAKLSKLINRIVVSTDSEEIAEVALKYGAEVPFLRPKKFATDNSTDLEFVQHALSWFKKNEGHAPDYLVHLRPTTPLRDPQVIDKAARSILNDPHATALRSVHEIRESPYKLLGIEKGYLVGLFPNDPRPEYYNLPRQEFPPVYQPNGYIDILVSEYILKTGKLHGDKILSFITQDVGELDKKEDVERIQYLLEKKEYTIYKYLRRNYSK
jgi:CMP-N,N'-diacetyllegionaminic acid synthase